MSWTPVVTTPWYGIQDTGSCNSPVSHKFLMSWIPGICDSQCPGNCGVVFLLFRLFPNFKPLLLSLKATTYSKLVYIHMYFSLKMLHFNFVSDMYSNVSLGCETSETASLASIWPSFALNLIYTAVLRYTFHQIGRKKV